MDLDPAQLGDLYPALSLLGRTSTVTCVHVQKPEHFPGSNSPAFRRAYESAVNESFAVTREAIARVTNTRTELIRLTGDPAEEMLRHTDLAKTELLVLGLRRHFGLRRLIGGGVALTNLRHAKCSVLFVPEAAAAR
jgi:nucleotide-binding universal stress UspA family protein